MTRMSREELATLIESRMRDIPDFPEPGIVFKDFTPLLLDGEAWRALVMDLADRHRGEVDAVAGIEARGFILGAALAYELGVGFVPLRKAGKLPGATVSAEYALEYGEAVIEMHTDAVVPGERVLIVDDVLATGGTAAAAVSLVEAVGASVAAVEVVLEIGFLNGREKLAGHTVESLVVA